MGRKRAVRADMPRGEAVGARPGLQEGAERVLSGLREQDNRQWHPRPPGSGQVPACLPPGQQDKQSTCPAQLVRDSVLDAGQSGSPNIWERL